MDGTELIVFNLIANAGDAVSKYYQSMEAASKGNFDAAELFYEEGNITLIEAHKIQTNIIHREVNGDKLDISYLSIHAQDHLASATLLKGIARVLIDLSKRIQNI